MIEMTLSSRHMIRNSSPGGLRPSTLPLGHGGSPQYWLSHVDGEETFFVSFKPPRPGIEPRTLAWKAAVLTTTLGPPPFQWRVVRCDYIFINKLTNFCKNVHILLGCVISVIAHVYDALFLGINIQKWYNFIYFFPKQDYSHFNLL